MLGLLPPECYFAPEIFELERERLFRRLWIFAGLSSSVSEPDSFITREIGGTHLVIQNFDGEIKAFENVCLHRGKLIQPEPFGLRPLVCGYHGWRYSRDGRVQIVPFEAQCYQFDAATRCELRLREFALERVGKLLFVNLDESPLPIDTQFNESFLEDLASASNAFDEEYLVARWKRRFNWKLAYENLRDMVHPRFVHTTTLNLAVTFPLEEVAVSEAATDPASTSAPSPELRRLSFGGAEGTPHRQRPPLFAEWVKRWGDQDMYFNWLPFPNTHVLSSDGGYSFSIEHHHPVSPTETEITAYFMTARKRRPVVWLAPTLWEMAKGAKRILDEDTDVMEEVQRAFGSASGRVNQGAYETQNRRTDRWYVDNVLHLRPARAQG